MRAAFCMFHDERGELVYINPLLVSYFTSLTPQRMMTKIVFDNGNSITVKGSPKEVVAGLSVRET